MIVFAVAGAGAAGALARYGMDRVLRARWPGHLTWPVLVINVSGSLLLGLVVGAVAFAGAPDALRTVAGTGFCASYTTFSTACWETLTLLRQGRRASGVVHALGTLIASSAAAGLGLAMASCAL